jgi:hypothetical protein
MLDEILREAFRLAHLRLRLIFLDLLWKVIWFVLTLAALLLVAAWFGSEFRSIGWMDTGNRAVNGALAFAVLRQFWVTHRTEMFAAVATALFFSLVIWFVLEAAFRSRYPLPLGEGRERVAGSSKSGHPHPTLSQRERVEARFSTFLLSNVLKCLIVTTAGFVLATICFGRYFVTPFAEWRQFWPDTRGAALDALVTVAALAFLLTIFDTLIRSDAIELLGTDLIRVTGLVGILVLTETMISGSCTVIVGVGILNIAGWREALAILGAAAVAMVFMTVLHSYLLLVRFSAVDIMRKNVVEV